LYQVVTEPTAWIDVEWAGLDEEGYEFTGSIRVKVVFLPLSEMQKVMSGEAGEDTVDFAKRVSRDWSQIVGTGPQALALHRREPRGHGRDDARLRARLPGFLPEGMARAGQGAGKKLRLARRWAGGRTSRDEAPSLEEQAAAIGAELPESLRSASPPDESEIIIWPDMQPAVSVFFGMRTQWRWVGAGMAGAFRTGLDYGALSSVAAIAKVDVTPLVLADLQVLESAAVEQWSRK
jgi:hypothetical protein